MRFSRQSRVFSGRLDAAPFAGVFFCLLLLIVLGGLLYRPGVTVELPAAADLPGAPPPTFAIALDHAGRLYYGSQILAPDELRATLKKEATKSREPVTLVIQADRAVAYEKLLELTLLARAAGIERIHLATLPRAFTPPPARKP